MKGTRSAARGSWPEGCLTWPIRHPYWTVLLCLATTGLLAVPASQVRSDNSSEIFELEDDRDRLFFDQYKGLFGASDFIVVTVTCGELETTVGDYGVRAEVAHTLNAEYQAADLSVVEGDQTLLGVGIDLTLDAGLHLFAGDEETALGSFDANDQVYLLATVAF